MNNHPNLNFKIEGHTDAIGPEAYNQKLSVLRAQAVANYLISAKISPTRLEIIGYGEEKPIAKNINSDGSDNALGRKYNRRVVLMPLNEIEGKVFLPDDEVPEEVKLQR